MPRKGDPRADRRYIDDVTPPDAAAAPDHLDEIRAGYAFEGPALDFGAAVIDGTAHPDTPVRIPLAVLNRHGLVAGATGTGKTRTLQGLVEQLSAAGVPVFAADIKGDLSGIATPGESNEKLLDRTRYKVNLIPYNPTGGIYTGSSPAAIAAFKTVLEDRGHTATVRLTRGRDIDAACGQPAAKTPA
jgi:hypothetical protein